MQRLALVLSAILATAVAYPAAAQVSAAPAASAASVPEARPARRPLSAEALRDSGTFPEDLQPDAPKPQVRLPLGRKPPAPSAVAASGVTRDAAAGRPTKVNDDVARCKAQATAPAREACLARLAPPAEASAPTFGR
jgi:hypothetical protein